MTSLSSAAEQMAQYLRDIIPTLEEMGRRNAAVNVRDVLKQYEEAKQRAEEEAQRAASDWKNWETREVYNWLGNDESTNREMERIVEREGSVVGAAKEIEDYVYDALNEELRSRGMFYSLIESSLDEVNWEEVAGQFKPEEWGNADEAPDEPDDDDEDTDEADPEED